MNPVVRMLCKLCYVDGIVGTAMCLAKTFPDALKVFPAGSYCEKAIHLRRFTYVQYNIHDNGAARFSILKWFTFHGWPEILSLAEIKSKDGSLR